MQKPISFKFDFYHDTSVLMEPSVLQSHIDEKFISIQSELVIIKFAHFYDTAMFDRIEAQSAKLVTIRLKLDILREIYCKVAARKSFYTRTILIIIFSPLSEISSITNS